MRTVVMAAAVFVCSTATVLAQTPSETTLPVMPMPSASATPHAHPSPRPTSVMTFANPGAKHALSSANGASCGRNAVAAQQRVNPITDQPQAGTLVSVPITPGGGSIASATNRRQQADACTHGH